MKRFNGQKDASERLACGEVWCIVWPRRALLEMRIRRVGASGQHTVLFQSRVKSTPGLRRLKGENGRLNSKEKAGFDNDVEPRRVPARPAFTAQSSWARKSKGGALKQMLAGLRGNSIVGEERGAERSEGQVGAIASPERAEKLADDVAAVAEDSNLGLKDSVKKRQDLWVKMLEGNTIEGVNGAQVGWAQKDSMRPERRRYQQDRVGDESSHTAAKERKQELQDDIAGPPTELETERAHKTTPSANIGLARQDSVVDEMKESDSSQMAAVDADDSFDTQVQSAVPVPQSNTFLCTIPDSEANTVGLGTQQDNKAPVVEQLEDTVATGRTVPDRLADDARIKAEYEAPMVDQEKTKEVLRAFGMGHFRIINRIVSLKIRSAFTAWLRLFNSAELRLPMPPSRQLRDGLASKTLHHRIQDCGIPADVLEVAELDAWAKKRYGPDFEHFKLSARTQSQAVTTRDGSMKDEADRNLASLFVKIPSADQVAKASASFPTRYSWQNFMAMVVKLVSRRKKLSRHRRTTAGHQLLRQSAVVNMLEAWTEETNDPTSDIDNVDFEAWAVAKYGLWQDRPASRAIADIRAGTSGNDEALQRSKGDVAEWQRALVRRFRSEHRGSRQEKDWRRKFSRKAQRYLHAFTNAHDSVRSCMPDLPTAVAEEKTLELMNRFRSENSVPMQSLDPGGIERWIRAQIDPLSDVSGTSANNHTPPSEGTSGKVNDIFKTLGIRSSVADDEEIVSSSVANTMTAMPPQIQSTLDPRIASLEPKIGYIFKNKDLLKEALKWAQAYLGRPKNDCYGNRRLAILGDRLIGIYLALPWYQKGASIST